VVESKTGFPLVETAIGQLYQVADGRTDGCRYCL